MARGDTRDEGRPESERRRHGSPRETEGHSPSARFARLSRRLLQRKGKVTASLALRLAPHRSAVRARPIRVSPSQFRYTHVQSDEHMTRPAANFYMLSVSW